MGLAFCAKLCQIVPVNKPDLKRPSTESIGPINSKRGGRPLAKDADKALSRTKPWEAEGMSRRTWYRRRAKKK
jgi:hypothetical protein